MKSIIQIIFIIFLSLNTNAQISNLDNYIQTEMELENIPGVAACVVKKGQVVWSGAYGWANIEEQIPVTTETLFTVASLSKLFVGTAIMQLYENGLIDLDADINNYLPFNVINPYYPDIPLTTRLLLQHKSGLNDPESELFTLAVEGDSPIDLGEYLENFLTPGGNYYNENYFSSEYEPGDNIWYSNIGFSLLGYIVESISGVAYHQFVQENIFDVLCMNNSGFFLSNINTEELAMPYYYSNGEYIEYGYYGFPQYPAALLKTNIEELANFLIAYTQRGQMDGYQILNENSAEMLTPYSFEDDNLAWWNGTLWTYTFHFPDDEVWFHGGYMNGVRTRINYYPADSTGIIILTNGQGQYSYIENNLASLIADFMYGEPDILDCHSSFDEDETAIEQKIKIYPNPFQNILYVNDNSNTQKTFIIKDMTGKIVLSKSIKNNYELNVEFIQNGLYFYEIRKENNIIQIGKLIK